MLSVILLLFIGLQSGLSSSLFQRECSLKVPENYSTSLPPKILDAEGNRVPLSVQIHSGGTEIEYVEEQTGRIGIAMIFEIKWHDPNIFALEENMNCIGKFPLEDFRSKFWIPPLVHENVRKSTNPLQNKNLNYGLVTKDQQIVIRLAMDNEITCKFDFRRYPFDHHNCPYRITSWFDNNEAVTVRTITHPQRYDQVQRSIQHFDVHVEPILNGSSFNFYLAYLTPPRNLSVTGLNIQLIRALRPYFTRYYGPSGGLVILAMVSFFIPAEMVAGRVALLVTLYLTCGRIGLSAYAVAPPVKDFLALNVWGFLVHFTLTLIGMEYAMILYLRFQLQKKARVFDTQGLETELRKFHTWTMQIDLKAAIVTSIFFALTSAIYFAFYLL